MIPRRCAAAVIPQEEIQWGPSIRQLDVNGRVFFWRERVLRGIHPHRVGFVERLFDSGLIDELVERDLLVPTAISKDELEGFGLVLEHEKQDVDTNPWEWSFATLKHAAITYLELTRVLAQHDLTLNDGHGGNFSMGPGGSVRWHDFGSIVELRQGSLIGLREFAESFMYPLELAHITGDPAIVRRLRYQLSREDFLRLRGRPLDRILLKSTRAGLPAVLRKFRVRSVGPDVRGTGPLRYARNAVTKRASGSAADATSVLDRLEQRVRGFRLPPATSTWSHYQEPTRANEKSARSAREAAIADLLEQRAPTGVLDIGANTGFFSRLAAEYAEVVIATDTDEIATARHVEWLQENDPNSRVYPLVHNVLHLTASEADRFRSDAVLALALTHHLRLGQGFPFDFIADMLSRLTGDLLITEFMPNGLGGARGPLPSPLPDDYTFATFRDSLRAHFRDVDIVDLANEPGLSPRTLVVCRR